MSYSAAIIGAGWYGCHIAMSLSALGFDVTVFEQNARPLHEASGNNQFRLHIGFHYPRHYGTRIQSRDGYMRFIERYPTLSGPISENIYAVPTGDSLIDFATYRLIMTASGIDYVETKESSIGLQNIDGMLLTPERVLYIEQARTYFRNHLNSSLQLGHRVEFVEETASSIKVNGDRFDFLIDATWGHFSRPDMKVFYEPTILLYYETKETFPAVTMVDGPLCSVYPTEDPNIYTLSSVVHTPLGQFRDAQSARAFRSSISSELVAEKVKNMEEQILRYIPDFRSRFTFIGPQLAIKTKPIGAYDDRSCYVNRRGRVFSVMSGKVDTVFFATERILSLIEASYASEMDVARSVLKEDILALAL